jgi:hypothetical protein
VVGGVKLTLDIREFGVSCEQKFLTQGMVALRVGFAFSREPTILKQSIQCFRNRFSEALVEFKVEWTCVAVVVVLKEPKRKPDVVTNRWC